MHASRHLSAPAGATTVREMREGDLPSVAALHAEQLPDGFFTRLGPHFLQAYLSTFRTVPGGVAVVAEAPDGAVAGFLVGSTAPGHNRAALRRHGRPLLTAALLALVARPQVAWTLLRTRGPRYGRALLGLPGGRGTGSHRPAPARDGDDGGTGREETARLAVLLHVAVNPRCRRSGAGRALLDAFVDASAAAGCDAAELVTFGEDAAPFYRRLGWSRSRETTDADGRRRITYRRTW